MNVIRTLRPSDNYESNFNGLIGLIPREVARAGFMQASGCNTHVAQMTFEPPVFHACLERYPYVSKVKEKVPWSIAVES